MPNPGDMPAFPIVRSMRNEDGTIFRPQEYGDIDEGVTIRDYFAAKVMQGLVASQPADWSPSKGERADTAEIAYDLADAMIAARAKPQA